MLHRVAGFSKLTAIIFIRREEVFISRVATSDAMLVKRKKIATYITCFCLMPYEDVY